MSERGTISGYPQYSAIAIVLYKILDELKDIKEVLK